MSETPESIVGRFDADAGEVALLPRLERYETRLAIDGSHLIVRFAFASGQVTNVAIPTDEIPHFTLAVLSQLTTLCDRRKEF